MNHCHQNVSKLSKPVPFSNTPDADISNTPEADIMLSYKRKSTLEFALSSQHVYQPGDPIEGNVIFNPPGDVILHEPCITLEGMSHPWT